MRIRVASLLFVAVAAACSRTPSPTSPSNSRLTSGVVATAPRAAGEISGGAAIDWRCVVRQSSVPGIFAAAAATGCGPAATAGAFARATTAQVNPADCETCRAPTLPVAGPAGLTATVAGSTVTLTWIPQFVTSYVVEAGSAPGLADLAAIDIGNPPLNPESVTFSNVSAGVYYVRVRSYLFNNGLSQPSNEVLVIVGASCAPAAPLGLSASVAEHTVSLTWKPGGGCNPESYLVQAGSAPGLNDLASLQISSSTPSLVAGGVADGVYYVRVRAANGPLVSPPSNEATVIVGASCNVSAPRGLVSSVSGSTVSLAWQVPAGFCTPIGYIIEAGSRSGAIDLANFATGNTGTLFAAAGVANGTYYIRVRAAYAAAIGPPSNEVVVRLNVVGPGFDGSWLGTYHIDTCTDIDPPGLTPLHLCQIPTTDDFRLELLREGASVRGVFTELTPLYFCACGGQYGTFDLAGTVSSDGTAVVSGETSLIGTGVQVALTMRLRMPNPPGLEGTVVGNLSFGGVLRGRFSATIVSATPH
jgi:hypothetical protein